MQVRPGDGGHVQIVAPANVTANGQSLNTMAPSQAHLAAAQPPVVHAGAPQPVSTSPIPTFSPRSGFSRLPEPRRVQPVLTQPATPRRLPFEGAQAAPISPGAPAASQYAPSHPQGPQSGPGMPASAVAPARQYAPLPPQGPQVNPSRPAVASQPARQAGEVAYPQKAPAAVATQPAPAWARTPKPAPKNEREKGESEHREER